MTVNEARQAADADRQRYIFREDFGVLRARIGLCREGLLKGDRCFGIIAPTIASSVSN